MRRMPPTTAKVEMEVEVRGSRKFGSIKVVDGRKDGYLCRRGNKDTIEEIQSTGLDRRFFFGEKGGLIRLLDWCTLDSRR